MSGTAHESRKWLTLQQAARELYVSERTIRRCIDRGLPVVRLGPPGSTMRIARSDLDAWLRDAAGEPSSDPLESRAGDAG